MHTLISWKITTSFFDSITMLKPTNIWNINIDNIVISKLIETKTNSKYFVGYWDKVIRPLVLIMPKMSEYVEIIKV